MMTQPKYKLMGLNHPFKIISSILKIQIIFTNKLVLNHRYVTNLGISHSTYFMKFHP